MPRRRSCLAAQLKSAALGALGGATATLSLNRTRIAPGQAFIEENGRYVEATPAQQEAIKRYYKEKRDFITFDVSDTLGFADTLVKFEFDKWHNKIKVGGKFKRMFIVPPL